MTKARTLMLYLALRTRYLLEPQQRDRGDLPAKAIVYAGMAVIAAALVTWATLYISGYLNSAPAAPGGP